MTTTVRVVDGKTQVLDGPYAETKEQLAGYYLIDVPDLDAALSWAARCPGASAVRSRSGRSGSCECRARPTILPQRRLRPSRAAAMASWSPSCRRARGDVAAAEDALAEAFAAALTDWPAGGIPRNPEAWLMAVAPRRLIDAARRRRTQRCRCSIICACWPRNWATPMAGHGNPRPPARH